MLHINLSTTIGNANYPFCGMEEYGDEHYWNERYRKEQGKTYDWLLTFEELKVRSVKFSQSSMYRLIISERERQC